MPTSAKPKSWRDQIKVHPAADLFPMMTPDELKALGADIRKQGQRVAIAVWKAQKHSRPELLDGRNRLDAMEAVGIAIRVDYEGTDLDPRVRLSKHMPPDGPWWPIDVAELSGLDPYDVVLSTNIHRRHLTAEQKRDLIAKVLKATPEKSNRQIAEAVKVDHKTVASVRAEKQATGEIPQLTKTVGKDGKARKTPTPPATTPNAATDSTQVRSAQDQQPPAKLIAAAHDVIIAKCVADVTTHIGEAVEHLDDIECVALLERLQTIINMLVATANRRVVESIFDEEPPEAVSPAPTKPKSPQPDDLDIPEFLRRQPS